MISWRLAPLNYNGAAYGLGNWRRIEQLAARKTLGQERGVIELMVCPEIGVGVADSSGAKARLIANRFVGAEARTS